ncbi:hypothetical protein CLOM_g21842 [Closterium sp. NIES-68]|nr:hypothetical protein CLOM_g21842 [Closterium sp. NIES-68]GJP78451.1 hypothetical protein CLOP_g8747 [Closterium sp. NIES-67]GJP81518.1 hypothetical protein CLOP_g11661 [Closterium sp. NIES-67]
MGSDQPQPSLQVTDRFVRRMLAEEASEKERKRAGKKGKGRGRGEHSRRQAGSAEGSAADGGSISSALLHVPPPLPATLNPLFFGSAVTGPSVAAPTAADSAVAAGSGVGFAAEAEAAYRAQRRKEELADIEKTLEQVKSLRDDIARQRQEEAVRATQMAQALQAQQFRPPSRVVPCQAEREECLRCYTQNLKNPLSCSSVVNKFVECSRQAQQAFMASEGRQ